jgi:hypothetical protein
MRVIAIVAAVVMLAAGCSSEDSPPAAAPTSASVEAPSSSTEPAESSEPPDGPHYHRSADEVLAAFTAAKLPVREPRDNSKNCDELQVGCVQLMTTEDVSIYIFVDAASREIFAGSLGRDAFVYGNVVLSYAAARTPVALRPRYQQVLTALR